MRHSNKTTTPLSQGESIAESSLRGESKTKTPTAESSLRGRKATEAIHKDKIDCHESANADSRNDDKTSPSLAEGARGWVNPCNDGTLDCRADKSARNDESNNLPQGWTIKTLGEVHDIILKGSTPKIQNKIADENSALFLKAENITKNGCVNFDNVRFIDYKTHTTTLKRSMLKNLDILITIAESPCPLCCFRN